MARQLVLDLPFRAAMGRSDFFVSDANAVAVAGVEAWRTWPMAKMLLIGPAGSGKTHLAHVFAAQSGARHVAARDLGASPLTDLVSGRAIVVEDADRISGDRTAEEALFHLHNAAAQGDVALLVTARSTPARWGMVLPDLESRMQQSGQLTLAAPDDRLIAAVLVKLAADRQMALSPALLAYIVARIDRSLAFARDFIARLDAESLAAKERPGQKHVRAILGDDRG